jgi:phosphomannomutase
MATPIKFGTDGWRAIIADDYTVDNVKRVAEATALYMRQQQMTTAVVGHDCRFAGELFATVSAQVLGAHGIKVFIAKGFVSTPMVSLGVVKLQAHIGVVITASHNPPSYNGFKLKAAFGGPMVPSGIAAVEALIPEVCSLATLPSLAELEQQGLLEYNDLESMYLDHARSSFDMPLIQAVAPHVAYDAMYGAGQNAVRALLPGAHLLHCEWNPNMEGQAPEPIDRNLTLLSETIRNNPDLTAGLANDGDADRIGMFDEDGKFVDSHHLLLILLLYLHKYKDMTGKVVFTFSVTDKMKKMAELFGLPYEITKIGFKYIAEIMTQEDVLVGGEESGGLAVKGHIPERDGVWMGLLVFEFMARTGKTIKGLVQEVYDMVGPFAFERDDLHITEAQKQAVIEHCSTGTYSAFGPYTVVGTESVDGFKFLFGDEKWVMIRPSGTEPVLRVYAQGPSLAECRTMLDATRATIL